MQLYNPKSKKHKQYLIANGHCLHWYHTSTVITTFFTENFVPCEYILYRVSWLKCKFDLEFINDRKTAELPSLTTTYLFTYCVFWLLYFIFFVISAFRHAWQKLGNMNPEAAMEEYMTLLSKNVPDWFEQPVVSSIHEKGTI